MKLKTLNRLKNNIVDKEIKRLYILDGIWEMPFTSKISKMLEGLNIELVAMSMHNRVLESVEFIKEDCLVLYGDTIMRNLNTNVVELIDRAKKDAGYMCVLTEDIFCAE